VAISGVFFPVKKGTVLAQIGSVFPMKHFIDATFNAFDPRVHGVAIKWSSLLVMGVWGLAGLLFAVRRFKWEPTAK
jgi:ABC-2 type transport system permease protein